MDSCGFFLDYLHTMDQPRCYFEINDTEVCMEPVEVLGHLCAAHTLAAVPLPPPIVRIARRQPIPDERRCTGIKKTGTRCDYKRRPGTERCKIHSIDAQPVAICSGILGSGLPCTRRSAEGGLCGMHFRTAAARFRRDNLLEWRPYDSAEITRVRRTTLRTHARAARALERMRLREEDVDVEFENDILILRNRIVATRATTLMQGFLRQNPEPLPELEEERAARSIRRVDFALRAVIEFNLRAPQIRLPVVVNPLARFANDTQNVHTHEANLILVAAEGLTGVVRDGVLKEIMDCWSLFGTRKERIRVRDDMTYWYNVAFVRAHNDFAYKVLLNRVWGVISTSTHREDMEKCLWAEALDSIGMCAQGHLTRLANALQGFDTNVVPEVSRSELLQTAMSQISELPPLERESAARRVFAELGVEESAQQSWLEALA